MTDYFTIEEVFVRLRNLKSKLGTVQALADHFGVSRVFMYCVLAGKNKPPEKMLKELGVKRLVVYMEDK